MSERREFEAALEAILFVTGEPVTEERLLAVFEAEERAAAGAALATLRERYRQEEGRGVFLEEVAGGLRIVTSPELHPYLKKFFEAGGGNRLSMAALETLAIVAYRQPITGPEIQDLRGKNSSAALKTLLERRMLRITGRKEVVGRPFLYATTRDFLMHFGLRGLSELPPLEEFEETFGGDAGAGETEAIAPGHESIGLVSTREAEAALGTATFDLHEPKAANDGAAAFAGERESAAAEDVEEAPAMATDADDEVGTA
jgi:segregation and condensation protein B